MDVARYLELKEKGAVSLMKLGGNGHYAVGIRKFDPNSGQELDPELERLTRAGVEKMKENLQQGVAACDTLLQDMAAAPGPAA